MGIPAYGTDNVEKFHGIYCGQQSSDLSFRSKPIDPLDLACMRHDQCYLRKRGSCACDRTLREAASRISNVYNGELQRKANKVVFAMSIKPCSSP